MKQVMKPIALEDDTGTWGDRLLLAAIFVAIAGVVLALILTDDYERVAPAAPKTPACEVGGMEGPRMVPA
jgi:hypothetical protein